MVPSGDRARSTRRSIESSNQSEDNAHLVCQMRHREREEEIDGLENVLKKLHRSRRIIPNSEIIRGRSSGAPRRRKQPKSMPRSWARDIVKNRLLLRGRPTGSRGLSLRFGCQFWAHSCKIPLAAHIVSWIANKRCSTAMVYSWAFS